MPQGAEGRGQCLWVVEKEQLPLGDVPWVLDFLGASVILEGRTLERLRGREGLSDFEPFYVQKVTTSRVQEQEGQMLRTPASFFLRTVETESQ